MAKKNTKETRREFPFNNVLLSLQSPVLGIANWAAHRYAEPAVSLAQDVIRKNVVVPVKKKLGVKISPRIKTEHDFSNPFLNTLDSINISQLDRQVPDWRQRTERGDTVRIGVSGKNYVPNYGGTRVSRSIWERMTNPLYQIETTLGSYGVEATKDNITVKDSYDWDTGVHLNKNSTYGIIRELMNSYGTSDSAPEEEKIKLNIKSRRIKND